MFYIFIKLGPEIRAIIVNITSNRCPKEETIFYRLLHVGKTTFYKTQTNSPRGNRNDHSSISKRKNSGSHPKNIALVITIADKTTGVYFEVKQHQMLFHSIFFKKKTINPFVTFATKKNTLLRIVLTKQKQKIS